MGIQFNVDEVLKIAVRIEHDGAAFYRRAAELKGKDGAAAFLLKLAVMEDEHERTIAAMRERLGAREKEPTAFDPYDEAALYLDALADAHGGEGAPSVAARLTGRESLAEILETAMGMEKQSILFYLGLRDVVPAKLGRDKIGAIINEERRHLVTLAEERRKLR